MRRFDLKFLLVAALLCAVASAPVFARGHGSRGGGHSRGHSGDHRHHASIGVVAVAPVFSPFYPFHPFYFPGSSYAFYPPEPSFPTLYIERGSEITAPDDAPIYWYYCPEAQMYYPDVQTCPLGWQQMVSQPPQS